MYASTMLFALLAATGATVNGNAIQRLSSRDIAQGWSVVSPGSTNGLTSCGSNMYCPSRLYCFDAKNSEVASCCSSNSPCVGAVEGAPSCADSSWNLYSGIDGNGFCCMQGMVGVIDRQARTVNCVASNAVGSSSTAVLTKSGTGSPATTAPSAAPTYLAAEAATSTTSGALVVAIMTAPSTAGSVATSPNAVLAPVATSLSANATTTGPIIMSNSTSSSMTTTTRASSINGAESGNVVAAAVMAFGLFAAMVL